MSIELQTRENDYFELNNGLLTGSKLKDYKKDPAFFYKKHVTGEIEQKITEALQIGSAVDCWLTAGKKEFDESYTVFTGGAKRDTKHPDFKYHLTEKIYDEVVAICEKVEQQPAYQDLMKLFECQKILKVDMDVGSHFDQLAGIPDWFHVDEEKKVANIVDYKTAYSADPNKYHYKCKDMGYYFQQAVYQMLIENLFDVNCCISKHLVTEKDPDGIYHSYTFLLNQERIDEEKEKLSWLLEDFKNDEEFKSPLATWDDMTEIGGKKNTEEFIEEVTL